MYNPAHFEEKRMEVLAQLMRTHPLAALITASDGEMHASHLPLHFDPAPAPYGTLRGHLARANPHWRSLPGEFGALAIFQGPQAYVSPRYYPSKQTDPRVVPTWDYIVVHARGPLTVHDDPAWLRAQVTALTREHEAAAPEPWQVSDAPAEYIEKLLGAIVGIELRIDTLEGKWKVSQNRPRGDREAVARELAQSHPELSAAVRPRSP